MTWEIAYVFGLLAIGLYTFVREKLPTDMTAILMYCALLLAGMMPFADTLPDVDALLSVFSNPAPITIAAMFIISSALDRCGAIDRLANLLGQFSKLGYRKFLVIMMLAVALVSAFINNTPVVVVMMPVVLSLSRQMNVPASKMLIPLSYASILGGTCTLVGTSTNILASGILKDAGMAPISMFELASLGIPLVITGILYIALFGNRLLPVRETLTSILSEEERKEYFTEAFVHPASQASGKSLEESGLLKSRSVRVLEIIREGVALRGDLKKTLLLDGDRLVLACRPSGIAHARSVEGINLTGELGADLETIAAHEGAIVEGVIGPKSTIVGKTIEEINFRQRFRMIAIAMHRRSENVRDKINTMPLEFGDTLLMMGTDKAIEDIRRSDDILLLDRGTTSSTLQNSKLPIVLGTIAAVILATAVLNVPIVATALIGVGFLFLTNCIKPKDGYAAIDWSIILLIYGMLGVGLALQTTGAASLIADTLVSSAEAFVPADIRPYVLLAAMYLCTSFFTELLSNNATIVVLAPIAITLGQTLGVDPRPFVIAVCIASSNSFASPIGYQTNTYVYGVGGYRFTDFCKVGIPLNLICFSVSIFVVPVIWPF